MFSIKPRTHFSDCAINNPPALPRMDCDCGNPEFDEFMGYDTVRVTFNDVDKLEECKKALEAQSWEHIGGSGGSHIGYSAQFRRPKTN